MKKNILSQATIIGIWTIMFLWLCMNIIVYAKEDSQRLTVRAGYYPIDGYYEKQDDGMLSGYGYELLQMISGYAGFDYEYIGYDKSWVEILQMLEDGEIDMLTSVQYSEERKESFEYSNSPVGYSEAVLTTNKNKTSLISGDYSSYDHMRVGMMVGSSLNETMFTFSKQHNFSFEPVYFGTQKELEKAMESGITVDAIVNSSMNILKEDCVLERFGRSPYYAVVKKGNIELMDKINYAINKMNLNNPSWMTELYKKYYSINDSHLYLNVNEHSYLEQLKNSGTAVSVIINPDLKPYSYFENGQAKGILVEYFNKICDLYSIQADYLKVDTAEEYTNAVIDHKGDLVLSPYFLRYEADTDGYNLTQPFLKASFCLITRTDKTYDKDFVGKKIAVVRGMTSVEQAGKEDFNQADFVFYSTADECIEAVKNQKADGTLLYSYTAYRYLNNNWDNVIQMFEIPDSSISFTIAVSKDCSPMLYNLMDYAVNAIPENDLEAIVFPAILDCNRADETLWEYISHRPVILNSMVIVISALLITSVLIVTKKYTMMQKKKRDKAEYEATHDILTGAYNRLKLNSIIDNPSVIALKTGVLMIDIDYFKKINDTYGHEMGDKVLQKLVLILQSYFRENDYIIRMGGDEFVIVLQNCDQAAWSSIGEKINNVHKKLNQEFSEKMELSLSAGVCFSEKGISKDMFRHADVALYYTKQMGRAGCTLINDKEEVINYWKSDRNK